MIAPDRQRIKRTRMDPSRNSRGVSLNTDSLTFIPAESTIRPLRDNMVVEPLDIIYSRVLIIKAGGKPMRGIVKAIGPGVWLNQYAINGEWMPVHHPPPKGKRTAVRQSNIFRATQVKVGDIVQLGGPRPGEGFSFEQFLWGDKVHLHCREEDCCGVET